MNENPYEPTVSYASVVATPRPVSRRRWAVIGFFLLALPPAILGFYGLYVDAQASAALPPGVTRCGMDAALATALIFPISPMLGSLGAVVGYVAAQIWIVTGRSSG